MPHQNLFWSVVLLRMALPVDVLSYGIGLFSKMSFSTYFWATLIGVVPFSFIYAYVGSLPVWYQVAILGVGGAVFVSGLVFKRPSS